MTTRDAVDVVLPALLNHRPLFHDRVVELSSTAGSTLNWDWSDFELMTRNCAHQVNGIEDDACFSVVNDSNAVDVAALTIGRRWWKLANSSGGNGCNFFSQPGGNAPVR
jgi:hypothetical protein